MVSLVSPAVRFESSYRDALKEFDAEGRGEVLAALREHESFATLVRELDAQADGRDLPKGWVPQSTFWLVGPGDAFIGKVEIRHHLTDALRLRGGHVGYAIRPTMRRRGYGTAVLSIVLPNCLELGLDRIMVTCDATNDASQKIIIRNGGELEDVIHIDGRAVPTMRFWIDVARQARFAI